MGGSKIYPKGYKPYYVSSKKFYIDKNYRTAHWVGYSKLKELGINDFQMNEKMKAEQT